MTTNNNLCAPINILKLYFSQPGYMEEEKTTLAKEFGIDERFLEAVIKQRLFSSLCEEVLGEYFYDADDFNDDGEYEGYGEFLIYNSDANFIAYCFTDEIEEMRQEFDQGIGVCALVNIFIERCVREYHESLKND